MFQIFYITYEIFLGHNLSDDTGSFSIYFHYSLFIQNNVSFSTWKEEFVQYNN